MATSVTGSRLAFFGNADLTGANTNVVLTDGTSVGPTVAGKFNIEVFTASPTGGLSKAAGFDAVAFVEGAVSVSGSTNIIQAGTLGSSEVLGDGSYTVVDQSGNEAITIAGSAAGSSVFSAITVIGATGDRITGSSVSGNTQLINVSKAGPVTVTGGAGPTTVWAGSSDSITGGAGALVVAGDKSSLMNIAGGAGNLTAYSFGLNDSVTGSTAGTTFIDDNYGGSFNTLTGGAGGTIVTAAVGGATVAAGTWIIAGKSDVITGGAGTTFVDASKGNGAATITAGSGATTVWGGPSQSITGGSGGLEVAGNAAAGETISGGTGNLKAYNLGKNDSVVGSSSGTSFIDDNYAGGGSDTIKGGAGATTVIAGSSDSIIGGAGTLVVGLDSRDTGVAINLTVSGRGAATLTDNSVSGATVGSSTVTGFSTTTDKITSATSVDSTNAFIGSSTTDIQGNTVLSFLDGSTMTLVGVSDVIQVKFTQS